MLYSFHICFHLYHTNYYYHNHYYDHHRHNHNQIIISIAITIIIITNKIIITIKICNRLITITIRIIITTYIMRYATHVMHAHPYMRSHFLHTQRLRIALNIS